MKALHHRFPSWFSTQAVVVLALAAVLASLMAAPPAGAVEDVTAARVQGPERTATAAQIALAAFPGGTGQAVVTTSATAQDALTASSYAGAIEAAMLLVNPDDVPSATMAALNQLGVTDVTIVGNTDSVSESVQTALGENFTVQRIEGDTPFATAAAVATATVDAVGLPTVDDRRTVLLANGLNFPDALAGSPAAFAGPTPVLYAEPDDLTDDTRAFLDAQDVEQVVLLGGNLAVDDSVAAEIEVDGIATVRLGGIDRVETAARIALWTTERFSFTEETLLLARADAFPDALTAGQLAGRFGRPLILSANPTILPAVAEQYFADRCDVIEVVQAIGGQNAVSTAILSAAEQAAETCQISGGSNPGTGGGSYGVDPAEQTVGLLEVDTVTFTDLGATERFDAVLVPCANVSTSGDQLAFADSNDDNEADGYETTQTGSSLITGVNNANVDNEPSARGVAPGASGDLSVQVSAFDDDCGAVVLIPAQESAAIPVDDDGFPTVDFGVGLVTFGTPPDPGVGPEQLYVVVPDDPVTSATGTAVQITVTGRTDGESITEALDIVLFPCDANTVLGSGVDRFEDENNDGGADGFSSTDNGSLKVTAVNGTAMSPDTIVGRVQPGSDGTITVTLNSDVADCATITVIDGNGNGKFDVDGDGVPTEPYGVAQVRFQ